MKTDYKTAADFAKDVVMHSKNAWVSGFFCVGGQTVGIKAFGKWVQVLQVNQTRDGQQFATQRAMKDYIVNACENWS